MGNPATGGCNCGAVRYQLTGAPLMTVACHCENCRRQSGSAFSVNLVYSADAIQMEGAVSTYVDSATESGNPMNRDFCGACGSPVRSRSSVGPPVAVIKAGTLDDGSPFAPSIHIWTSARLDWVTIPDDVAQFDRNIPA